jgi:hypothetical protein
MIVFKIHDFYLILKQYHLFIYSTRQKYKLLNKLHK